MSLTLAQAVGYLASVLVFATFYMRTMLPLRGVAIGSNISFLVYGLLLHLWPVAILHALLLPLNTIRLIQIRRMLDNIQTARATDVDIHAIARSFTLMRYAKGAAVFRRGEPADSAFYVAKGEVSFPEIRARCAAGELFGEIGVFSSGRVRTASAFCATDAELYRIDEHAIVMAFYQDPAFAFSVLRLVTQRLLGNFAHLESELAKAHRSTELGPHH